MSISAAVVTLRPTIERLAEFAALSPGWDSYDGLPSTPRAVSTATELLVLLADHLPSLQPDRMVPFAVTPIADGGVQLEWRGSRQQIEVEVGPTGELGYLSIEGRGAERRFEEQSDISIDRVLDLITLVLIGEPAG